MTDFPKLIAVVAGPSECGKSQLLWDLFLSKIPRRLSIDFNDEMARKFNPDAIVAYSLDDCLAALRTAAGYASWHVALVTPIETMKDVVPKLARYLNPTRSGPDHTSYPIAVGGMSIDCSEGAEFFPNLGAEWVRHGSGFFSRGRHNRLTMLMATGRPQDINRRATEHADHLIVFRTQEQRSLKYWAEQTSPAIADVIAELPQFHAAWIQKEKFLVYVLDDKRAVTRILNYQGADVEQPA